MSLVDYATSSDDDVSHSEHEPPELRHESPAPPRPPPRPPSPPRTLASVSSADQKPGTFEKLPDASELLNSPTVSLVGGNDHASVVAAAMAESVSRKRDWKGMMGLGSSVSVPPPARAKLPRATLTHSKSVPDTRGVTLVPPQLKGRAKYFPFTLFPFYHFKALCFFIGLNFLFRRINCDVMQQQISTFGCIYDLATTFQSQGTNLTSNIKFLLNKAATCSRLLLCFWPLLNILVMEQIHFTLSNST